ncbi:hemerythrin domain-containing protein [Ideonella sp. BN130291]|uniref:hemerythrin domain-containing protein n=1 Tax=Ideonella sp. BN130291 TaxID=3112940 RepID=UPI002E270AD3|nr:hemerythrin domain-containing protein [Ideonella sp. BN130291]
MALLQSDNQAMKALFDRYAGLVQQGAANEQKRSLADDICWTVTVHMAAKEEIFYPAAADAIDAQHLLHEATVEHNSTRHLIADLVSMSPDKPHFDATMKVLGGHVGQHVGREESDLFPKVRQSSLDLRAIGERFAERKEEIMAEVEQVEA